MAYESKWQRPVNQNESKKESRYRTWPQIREAMEELDKKGAISPQELISLEIQLSIASSLGNISRLMEKN